MDRSETSLLKEQLGDLQHELAQLTAQLANAEFEITKAELIIHSLLHNPSDDNRKLAELWLKRIAKQLEEDQPDDVSG